MPRSDWPKVHLLRRAGFGVSPDDWEELRGMSFDDTVDWLVDYEAVADDVDTFIGDAGHVGVTPPRGASFSPNSVVTDSRQRWLFRMVHSRRPLEEKMALFWHNLFATGYSKIAGIYGSAEAARMMAANPEEDPGRVTGQVELFRQRATGNFRDLLVAVARDPAMLVWLDGRSNVKSRPQENFGRELMELFTMGVGFYTEPDVLAAARVFTGWNLQRVGVVNDPAAHYEFFYNSAQHDTAAKTFSFPVYSNGGRTIPARTASDGQQDGLDLIDGLARHPETARRLARRLYAFFVSESAVPPASFVDSLAGAYLANGCEMKPLLRALFSSQAFTDSSAYFARCAWPAEFVARAIKEAGWKGFSVNDALTPLSQMGQVLYDPPSVGGWQTGTAWFSTSSMLARMNFAASLAKSQRAPLADWLRGASRSPESLLSHLTTRILAAPYGSQEYGTLLAYAQSGSAWTGTAAQVQAKVGGLAHLIMGSAEYQVV
jgi:uncharacterized protein (DUF1800 family)